MTAVDYAVEKILALEKERDTLKAQLIAVTDFLKQTRSVYGLHTSAGAVASNCLVTIEEAASEIDDLRNNPPTT